MTHNSDVILIRSNLNDIDIITKKLKQSYKLNNEGVISKYLAIELEYS